MFKCFFIKRKLYSYLDDVLSPENLRFVKNHLNDCSSCRAELEKMEGLVKAAQSIQVPQLNNEAWHDFKVDLDRKLNARLVPEFKLKRGLGYQLRPVLVYASVLIFVFGLWIYQAKINSTKANIMYAYDDIVNNINFLDELDQGLNLNHDEDAYIEEINLLSQLESDIV